MARNGVGNESLHHERFHVEQTVAPRHWQDLPVKHLVMLSRCLLRSRCIIVLHSCRRATGSSPWLLPPSGELEVCPVPLLYSQPAPCCVKTGWLGSH